MNGLPRRPSRVAQTDVVAEKQKYVAVPYGDVPTQPIPVVLSAVAGTN